MAAVLAVPLAFLAGTIPAVAQQDLPDDVQPERFIQRNWSQIFPDFGFETGCVTGYLAFEFDASGGFIFNHRTHGSWRVDGQGNITLQTRAGERIRLLFDGNHLTASTASKLFRRNAQFQECP